MTERVTTNTMQKLHRTALKHGYKAFWIGINLEEIMPVEGSTNTSSNSETQPEMYSHPVKTFFDACGMDTTHFPIVKFLIETSEKELRCNRLCVPLRIPESDVVYESFFRVTRVLELPMTQGQGHRKFVEIEWLIELEDFREEDLHPANSFLASEMSCPACRVHFIPNPMVLGEFEVKISCPQCLQEWVCKIQMDSGNTKATPLLLDLMRRDPIELRRMIKSWDDTPILQTDAFYYSLFPYSFEKLDGSGALDWLVGEANGWLSLPMAQNRNFETLIRGLINTLSFGYIKHIDAVAHSSHLEKTDVHRKSEIKRKDEIHLVKPAEALPKKQTAASFTWEPKEFAETKKILQLEPRRSHSRIFIGLSAALIFILVSLVGFQYFTANKMHDEAHTLPSQAIKIANIDLPEIPEASTPKLAEVIPDKKLETNESIEAETGILAAKIESKNVVKKVRESLKSTTAKVSQAETNYRKGMLHLKLQQGHEAASLFENIVKTNPEHALAYRGLGIAYFYDKQYERSIEALEKYLKVSGQASDRKDIEEILRVLRDRIATASLTP